MNLQENIRRILREEINKKYSKPNEKVENVIHLFLNDYFEGAEMEHTEPFKFKHNFDFCKNGRKLGQIMMNFEYDDSNRPTSERRFDDGRFWLYEETLKELHQIIPIRLNYLKYVIEEWVEDTYLEEIQNILKRNDISIDIFDVNKNKPARCVPPMKKPEDITMQDMMDYIKKNTLFTYKDMEEHEEDESGWIEKTYLGILTRKEDERLNG